MNDILRRARRLLKKRIGDPRRREPIEDWYFSSMPIEKACPPRCLRAADAAKAAGLKGPSGDELRGAILREREQTAKELEAGEYGDGSE